MKDKLQAGIEHHRAGDLAEAANLYRSVLNSVPNDPDALHLLALVLAVEGQEQQAIAMIEKAIEQRPGAAAYHHNLAGIYRRSGSLGLATQHFQDAFSLKPDYGEAYQGYSEMVSFDSSDNAHRDFITRVLAQLESPGLTDSTRSYLHFSAGKYFNDIQAWDSAFEHYQKANAMAGRTFDADRHRSLLKDVLHYQHDLGAPDLTLAQGVAEDAGPQPIFVVGMPRSGTSLVEQILASHSKVLGAGELQDMAREGQRLLTEVKRLEGQLPGGLSRNEALRRYKVQAAQRYLQGLRSRPGLTSEDWIVDKHPLNFRFLGIVRALLPRAKIIHLRRHPLDICLSCYFQNFTQWQDYSFYLPTLGQFYQDYVRIMHHWRQYLGDDLCEIDYESLVTNSEQEIRRMLAFCQLRFEPGCLRFYETDRSVSTASFKQVRQPMYQTSQARWRSYAEQLRHLARQLGLEHELPVTVT